MFVLDPVEVVVDNLSDDYEELATIPYRPGTPEFGERTVPLQTNSTLKGQISQKTLMIRNFSD